MEYGANQNDIKRVWLQMGDFEAQRNVKLLTECFRVERMWLELVQSDQVG